MILDYSDADTELRFQEVFSSGVESSGRWNSIPDQHMISSSQLQWVQTGTKVNDST